MTTPTEFDPRGWPRARSYSRLAWHSLVLVALAVALLPIPVAGLRLLPSYRVHTLFLLFFAPLVCVLILAYLVYIRDSLARLVLTDAFRLQPRYRRYHRSWTRHVARRSLPSVWRALLALLPALLLITSLYCLVQYMTRFEESVALATRMAAARITAEEEVGYASPMSDSMPASSSPRSSGYQSARRQDAARPGSLGPTREFVLQHTGIDGIPLFWELTTLYIGAFVSALLAVTLMALKEYARDAAGLTEEELVLRRTHDHGYA